MVGVLLLTHGSIGQTLLEAADHVLGSRQSNARALAILPQDDPAEALLRARAELSAVDSGDGAIVFVDIFGATPSNLAARLLQPGRIEGLAGVSLPMLVRALAYRHLPLEQVLVRAIEAGTRGQLNMKEDACNATAGGS
jgi:PTS system ascorbate-specific IIA component